jgi:hypothetical protein
MALVVLQTPQVQLPVLNQNNTFSLPWYRFFQQLSPVAKIYTLSSLPEATSSVGSRFVINDSLHAAIGNFGTVAVNGGTNIVPVYSDGQWKLG